jgi:hypothetical protein
MPHFHPIVPPLLVAASLALLANPGSIAAQTTLLQVADNDAPDGPRLLHVNSDGALVAMGREGLGVVPMRGPGVRLMWYPRKAAFRAGEVSADQWDDEKIGPNSMALGRDPVASNFDAVALGSQPTASGIASVAIGDNSRATNEASIAIGAGTTASAQAAIALGVRATARGLYSVATGLLSEASGESSIAAGNEAKAVGVRSMALGYRTTAADERATVMGSNAGTFGGRGSFVYGDASTTTAVVSTAPNEFVVRASGGFRLRTSPTLNTGCNLTPGSASWDCTSSRLAKEKFEDVDGEAVLEKLAAIRIQRWHYRGSQVPHLGPTAEDFYDAFALGTGPTSISSVDADGISLVAVQALERRTTQLLEQNAALQTQLEELRRIVTENRRVAP